MSKKNKSKNLNDKPRPCFECPKCKQRWVKDCIEPSDAVCISCRILGIPLNDGAKKAITKIAKEI